MRCDFFLQPLIFTCKSTFCRQSALARGVARFYPGMDRITQADLRRCAGARFRLTSWIFATRSIGAAEPIYTDFIHVNEAGNRLVAERIAEFTRRAAGTLTSRLATRRARVV